MTPGEILTAGRACEAAARWAAGRMGGTLFNDAWPGFATADGWRYRVAKGGTFWVAINHDLGKTGRGAWPELAREQALVREFS
jgi:hypothetical protein